MTDDATRALLDIFRTEAADALDELAQLASELGSAQGSKLRNAAKAALRLAHNIKGAAGSVGLEELSSLAHTLEDALGPCAVSSTAPPHELCSAVLSAVSLIERLCEAGHECDPALAEQARELGQRLLEQSRQYAARLEPSTVQASAAPPSPGAGVPAPAESGGSDANPPESTPSTAPARPQAEALPTHATVTHLRVPAARLDELAGHVDEMIVLRGRIGDSTRALERAVGGLAEALASSGEASSACEGPLRELVGLVRTQRETQNALVRRVSELGDCVRRVRTVPLATVAPFWRRVVRECAQLLGKQVTLDVNVGDTELDKQVLDKLRDPFLHLLRNAVDHGIEGPEERYVLGKPAQARIVIDARMVGARVVLEVRDDGQGLVPEEVAQSAIDKGIITRAQADRMLPADKLDLLFFDGFSTASRVSTISGRGVGLSAVRDAVRQLGGECTVESSGYGDGTTARVSVPMSVLAMRGLLVEAEGVTYVLPTDLVERAVRVKRDDVRRADGQDVVPVADCEPIAVHWLDRSVRARPRANDVLSVIVAAVGRRRAGLVVGEVLDEHECVVKHLPWNLKYVYGINGAVVLPSGSTALSLDPQFVLDTPRDGPRSAARSRDGSRVEARRPKVLVVDDSLTSRTLERNILASAGYDVDVAVDGREAWALLGEREVDLLVADVQMPNMDGFELTRRVRADPRLGALPVILVTALAGEEDIAKGAAAGADEYLIKGELEHDKLVEAVARYLLRPSA
ncbi:MAG: response regulator [Polyangiaceae bacterium]|nr:response regulator [Polyangiaceae bacterium]